MSKDAVYEFVRRADSDAELGYALRGAAGIPAVVRVAAERGFQFTGDELAPVLDLLRFLDDASRDAGLRSELASAPDPAAVVALGRGRGYAFSSEELDHLQVGPATGPLAERDLDRVVGGMNFNVSISSIRGGSVSSDFSVGRGQQMATPKKSFGSKLADGLSVIPTEPAGVPVVVSGTGSGGGTTPTDSD